MRNDDGKPIQLLMKTHYGEGYQVRVRNSTLFISLIAERLLERRVHDIRRRWLENVSPCVLGRYKP